MSSKKVDLIIKNAFIYDGSGSAAFQGEIAVKDDKIIAIASPDNLTYKSDEIVDAKGAALAPGFIDVHSHSDTRVIAVPSADSKISQGVTSEVVGNCGFSDFVISRESNPLGDSPLGIMSGEFKDYIKKVEEAEPAVNIAALCGHNSLRVRVMGYSDREANDEELAEMKKLLEEALEQGAAGFSSGLWYIPGSFSNSEEVKKLAAALKGTGKVYATHMRSEGNQLIESLNEAIEIARAGDNSLQISHFKTAKPHNWHKIDKAIEIVENAQKEGMDILADRYPYIYSSTSLRMVVPKPYDKIDNQKLTEMLKNSEEERKKLIELLEKRIAEEANWDGIILVRSELQEHKQFIGKTIEEIANMQNISPAEAYVKILSQNSPAAVFRQMCEENLKRFLAKSWMISGSDGSIFAYDNNETHPRAFGTFPNFFQIAREFAKDEEVIKRMTSMPAEKFNLPKRGRIAPGYFADLVIFKPEEYISKADFVKPNTVCKGVERVYVNGKLAYANNKKLKTQRAGKFLKVGNRD